MSASCTRKDHIPVPPGSIKGTILSFDEFGREVPFHSSVDISLNGVENFTGRTQTTGEFIIHGVPPGTYWLQATHPFLSMYRKFGIRVLSGNTTHLGNIRMVQPATTVVSEIDVFFPPAEEFEIVTFTGKIKPAGTFLLRREVRLFFGKTPQVSPTNYQASVSAINIQSDAFLLNLLVNDFLRRGFSRGEMVYAIAYGSSRVGESYVNQNGVEIFTGLNPLASNVIAFRLPR
ncbi:MAG: carboxypeptidase-like regulatory domain-containing protein [Cytophagales bacterium]|nr:carboxypeptidase-like regulatory domain-containing protein [Bernardetiaceae bacterium]MDW8205946.1 carboxypeptidase-like regulatory domain-containing protein [Cytophagales bacterium]